MPSEPSTPTSTRIRIRIKGPDFRLADQAAAEAMEARSPKPALAASSGVIFSILVSMAVLTVRADMQQALMP